MYTPAPRADTNNIEFLELYNSNPYFEDISGFQLVGDSMSYTFPSGTILDGGAFLVVAASPGSIWQRLRHYERGRPLHRQPEEGGHH